MVGEKLKGLGHKKKKRKRKEKKTKTDPESKACPFDLKVEPTNQLKPRPGQPFETRSYRNPSRRFIYNPDCYYGIYTPTLPTL